ncbi:MAG: DUF1622 domain-containing protein [Actinomycetota bacterium]
MSFNETIELIARVVDGLGVAILLVGALVALIPFLISFVARRATTAGYHDLRGNLGRAILLGLEFLVAADIIRTVAIAPTLGSVAALGLIVLIRTFLSAALQVELEGRWPWQSRNEGGPGKPTSADT